MPGFGQSHVWKSGAAAVEPKREERMSVWFGGVLGRFYPILFTSSVTVVPAGTEGGQSPFPAHTALAGAVLLKLVFPWEKGALQVREGLTAAASHPWCMPVENLTNDSALSWLLSPQPPGTGLCRAPGLGTSLLLLLAVAGGQCQQVTG